MDTTNSATNSANATAPMSSPAQSPPQQASHNPAADSHPPHQQRRRSTPSPPPLDPRIQIELENLNTATDDINRLEIELEEANATFRILLNESTRRLKLLSKKLGACIDKSRPYHEAADRARLAQIDCQAAAVQFQRAHEHYAAAKETVALAEQRFMSGSHEWQFDNAWQEMLNHATLKVAAAEQQKRECHAEHERRAAVFRVAEVQCSQLEDGLRRHIQRSRPYFEEKQICQDQLQTQKERIQELQHGVAQAKRAYAQALKALETISEEIHRSRASNEPAASAGGSGPQTPPLSKRVNAQLNNHVDDEDDDDDERMPRGPREPGVGAEKGADEDVATLERPRADHMATHNSPAADDASCSAASPADDQLSAAGSSADAELPSLNFARELDSCDVASTGGGHDDGSSEADAAGSMTPASENEATAAATGANDTVDDDAALDALRRHIKLLAVRPVDGGGDGQPQTQDVWETELNATVDRLDRLLMHRENNAGQQLGATLAPAAAQATSMPATPLRTKAAVATPAAAAESPVRRPSPVRQLQKAAPLPQAVVSMGELPLLARLSTELSAVSSRLLESAARVGLQPQPQHQQSMVGVGSSDQPKRRRSLE